MFPSALPQVYEQPKDMEEKPQGWRLRRPNIIVRTGGQVGAAPANPLIRPWFSKWCPGSLGYFLLPSITPQWSTKRGVLRHGLQQGSCPAATVSGHHMRSGHGCRVVTNTQPALVCLRPLSRGLSCCMFAVVQHITREQQRQMVEPQPGMPSW